MMPQMAPIMWLPMFIFFLLFLYTFIVMNFYIKPFNKIMTTKYDSNPPSKHWKL
uniref:ATP synthase complex subunit 8 n=1 Tax=Euplax sp. TaxID=2925339 RepID=A0A8T9ELN6_9EUCA|nr:ATP synthase F0 subunit 8 [Euplax sp.]